MVRGGERSGGEVGVRRRFEKSGMCVEMKRIFYYVCLCGVYVHLLERDISSGRNVIKSCFSRRGITKLKGHLLYYHEKIKDSRERSSSSLFFPSFIFHFFFIFIFFVAIHAIYTYMERRSITITLIISFHQQPSSTQNEKFEF